MRPRRLVQSRTRGQQWIALTAALLLTGCFAQHRQAQAATIQVNTTQQGVTSDQCSLQEAIYASELKANKAVSKTDPDTFYATGCTAGTGDDTIVLPTGAAFTFDKFWEGDAHNIFGPTATPIIFSRIIIEGNGATLQWVGSGTSRLITVAKVDDPPFGSGIGRLTLRNVYVKGFHVKGGDGGPAGGGGLGAGGAIYVNTGSLTVENSTFENNGAVGGNGGEFGAGGGGPWGGGGGGLSGNGGDGCSTSGGGGGGSRGDGGKGGADRFGNFNDCHGPGGGGGGGGNVGPGVDGVPSGGGRGGLVGGGAGGNPGDDGKDAHRPGAGGGGAGGKEWPCSLFCSDGGHGSYGGGGGGGEGDGGDGGFGAGGGGGGNDDGGDGGFGGGGGADDRHGGPFGGKADDMGGGGGGALGGAIFNHDGEVRVNNSTFFNNFVTRGAASGSAANGADAGGAIFSLNNLLVVKNSTFAGNQSTGSGGAIVVYRTASGSVPVVFNLNNTIIALNGSNECFFTGNVAIQGAGNLIMNNGTGHGSPFTPCPGVVSGKDPQLQPLQLNSPGTTPTMAIQGGTPAFNAADPGTSLSTDQRGVARPQGGGFDIGAFETTG